MNPFKWLYDTVVSLCWVLWHIKPIAKSVWQEQHGRYFVFRDAPDAVIDTIASFEDPDERLGHLVKEAQTEQALRRRQAAVAS